MPDVFFGQYPTQRNVAYMISKAFVEHVLRRSAEKGLNMSRTLEENFSIVKPVYGALMQILRSTEMNLATQVGIQNQIIRVIIEAINSGIVGP
jgi:hypothetical protein